MATINLLTDEIIVEIFGYLSQKTIKNCSLVCKRWDDIIGNSKTLMERFQLILINAESCEKLKETKRKHQQISLHEPSSATLNMLKGRNLHTLTICGLVQIQMQLSDFIEVLNNLPLLKILKGYSGFIGDDLTKTEFKKVCTNLEELSWDAGRCHIFACSTIKYLNLIFTSYAMEQQTLIFEFLNRQKDLQDFKLVEFGGFFNSPGINFEAFEFRLKSFEYDIFATFEKYQEFIRFLEPHKRSLATLSTNIRTKSMITIEQIQKYVLENLSNLKDLELDMHYDNYNELAVLMEVDEPKSATCVTNNIERFKHCRNFWRHRSQDEKKRFIDMFPKIKDLYYDVHIRDELQLLNYISVTKVNLESLRMYMFPDSEASVTIFFPHLKELSFEGILHGDEALISFVNRHSRTLEKIKVGNASKITELTVNEIIKCENLKQISLGVSTNNLLPIMSLFHKISFGSKPLTFVFYHYSSTTKFKLPEDKIFWDEKIKSLI